MILTEFQRRLKRVHPGLYVGVDSRRSIPEKPELNAAGIYLKRAKRSVMHSSRSDRYHASAGQQKYLDEMEAGLRDQFICGICLEHIPEYDVFHLEQGKMLMPGWRKIALHLVESKLCTLDQAKKIFGSSSLGEQTYDKLEFHQRLSWAREASKWL